MSIPKVIILLLYLAAVLYWAMNIWGGWAEKFYDKAAPSSMVWSWLKVLKIELTKENCVKYIKITSMASIVFFGLDVAIIFLLPGKP